MKTLGLSIHLSMYKIVSKKVCIPVSGSCQYHHKEGIICVGHFKLPNIFHATFGSTV